MSDISESMLEAFVTEGIAKAVKEKDEEIAQLHKDFAALKKGFDLLTTTISLLYLAGELLEAALISGPAMDKKLAIDRWRETVRTVADKMDPEGLRFKK